MRKITRQAIDAFMNGYEFRGNNTVVKQYGNGQASFELFGHRIAWTDSIAPSILHFTDCGYVTATTYERLHNLVMKWTGNAFGCNRKLGNGYLHSRDSNDKWLMNQVHHLKRA